MANKCTASKKNGSKCSADAQIGKDVCVFHDPEKADVVRQARQAGGVRRSQPLAVLPPDTPDCQIHDASDISSKSQRFRRFSMRNNSTRQSAVSRANGSKSKGPKSPAGKRKAAQNSIRDGLFSSQVVIEHLGEKHADFEQLKNEFVESFQPSNPVEEKLVYDYTVNCWRLERIRRAEAKELDARMNALRWQDAYDRHDALESLRSRVIALLLEWNSVADRTEIIAELEKIRQQRMATPEGISDLIVNLECLKNEVLTSGALDTSDTISLLASVGFHTDALATWALLMYGTKKQVEEYARFSKRRVEAETSADVMLDMDTEFQPIQNSLEKEINKVTSGDFVVAPQSEFQRIDEAAELERTVEHSDNKVSQRSFPNDTKTSGENGNDAPDRKTQEDRQNRAQLLAKFFEELIKDLRRRRAGLRLVESYELERRRAVAVLDPTSDRFSRAETVYERRMHRALAALSVVRGGCPLPPSDSKEFNSRPRTRLLPAPQIYKISKRTREVVLVDGNGAAISTAGGQDHKGIKEPGP